MYDIAGRVTANLNVRLQPNTRTKPIPFTHFDGDGRTYDWIPAGTPVRVAGRTLEKDQIGSWNNYWYLLEVPTDAEGSTGYRWAFAEFIELEFVDGP